MEDEKMLEALKKNQELLAESQRLAKLGSYERDLLTGKIFWTDEMFELFDVPRGTQPTLDILLSRIHPDDRAAMDQYVQAGKDGQLEFRIIRRSKEVRVIQSICHIREDKEGCALQLFGTAQDITERKHAEEKLFDSETHLRLIIELEPECVKLLARDNTVLEMNPAGLRFLEADSSEQVIGKSITPGIVPEYRAAFKDLTEKVFRGETGELEYEIIGFKGTHRWLHTNAVPFRDSDGRIKALLGITRDITDNRKLEDQLRQSQKLEALGQLAGGIAHDFNNVITVISGYSELLSSALGKNDPHYPDIQEIQKAADRAKSLTAQLLAFSRREKIVSKATDLNEVLKSMNNMLRRLIGEQIEFKMLLAERLPKITVDSGQLQQVILNLSVNARDAMPGGGVLTLETSQVVLTAGKDAIQGQIPPGDYVLLTIHDTGSGMSSEVQKHLFEPFFTTKEKGKGTGLGLATSHGILKQMAAFIAVESKVGTGTNFIIYFSTRQTPLETRGALPPKADGYTVLLVEDETIVRNFSARVLRSKGYEVIEQVNGVEALDFLKHHKDKKIDIVFTDIMMPKMNGKELVERVHTMRPEVKVLFTSGYIEEDMVRESILNPSTAFIRKPYSPQVLSEKLEEVLKS